jgi:MFS family permease
VIDVVRRNPAFARLWISQIVSQTGDWLNRMACIVLIARLGGDSTALGAFFGVELMLRVVPPALLGPLAGPLADRWSRRLLMVGSDVARAVIVLAFLLVDEPGELGLLYTLIFLQMAASVFFDIARTAALPDTVPPEDLFDAHALSAATWSVILGVGALLSGLLVAALGLQAAFVADAASYVLSALVLVGLPLPRPKATTPFRWSEIVLFTDLRRGYAHAKELGIETALWTKTMWGGAGGFLVVLSLAGSVRFGETDAAAGGAHATGALFSARGLGTWIGPILLKLWLGTSDRALRRQIALGFAFAAAGYAAFGFTEDLLLSCLAVGFAHLGGSALWVASTILWQRHVGESFRGRVFAFEYLGMCLSFALFGMLAGWIFDRTRSLSLTVWWCAGFVLVLGAAWTLLARRDRLDAPVRAAPVEPTESEP